LQAFSVLFHREQRRAAAGKAGLRFDCGSRIANPGARFLPPEKSLSEKSQNGTIFH
jgi:hypothetical protein